jgi:hypothetical protein
VDERQRGTPEGAGPRLGHLDAAGVGRDDRQVALAVLALHVPGQDRHRQQVIDRAVEEALDLGRVQIDGHQAVGARGEEEVGHQARRDGFTSQVLLVLPGVAVEGEDHGDPLGRRPLERVDHDELLHDRVVDRRRVALQHEGVAAAHGLVEADVDLAVGEVVRRGGNEVDLEEVCHLLGQHRVRPTREEHDLLRRGLLEEATHLSRLPSRR